MVVAHDRAHRREQFERLEQVVSDLGVRAHERALLGRQRRRLEQHAVGDADLAHVVQQRAQTDGLDFPLPEADLGSEARREPGQTLRVAAHPLRAGLDRVCERARQRRRQQALPEVALGSARSVERLRQRQLELGLGERLADEAVRAAGERLAQVVAGGRARHEHDRQVRPPDAHGL